MALSNNNNETITAPNTKDFNCNKIENQKTDNTTKSKSPLKRTRYRYIPPHLRGREIQKPTEFTTKSSSSFKWYKDKELFESVIGLSLTSFKLNDPSYINQNKLDILTRINSANSNITSPTIIFIIGPPSIGKSSIIYDSYFEEFFNIKEENKVNTDGDLIRKCHYGINKYLELSNKLNIGFDGFFKYYVQKWSAKWKFEIRQKIMKNKQNIIAFSTCHKSQDLIKEINMFINNGYNIKILMICGEYNKCTKMGQSRERINGRKYLYGAYSKSIQGCIDIIQHLLKNRIINDNKNDLIVLRIILTKLMGINLIFKC